MTTVYFVIAALALVGAGVLLWLDRNRSEKVHHQRAVWGEAHSFKYRESDSKLRSAFGRAAMAVPEHVVVRDVAYGHYEGAEAVVFDLDETATVVAVRRSTASPVTVDLRYEDVLAPAEEDVDLLGAMGSRVMFASDLDAARRVCDRRMVELATSTPDYIEILWNEGNWALGSMPLTSDSEMLDVALDTVRRFADLLRALPVLADGKPDPERSALEHAVPERAVPVRQEPVEDVPTGLLDKQQRERTAPPRGGVPAETPRRPAPAFDDESSDLPAAAPSGYGDRPSSRPGGQRSARPTPFGAARAGRDRVDPQDLPPMSGQHDRD
ncbi:MAG: hypothetical protein QM809_02155 [Gordonia sp. (in: high G+C Gram-positive bacteria)]|uniref:hypothetical protein n=1 Tax=Gordonia sp. (in: high G+C Gram-positive bacteria) TaxID=84139 RepID=UPI0039E57CE3